MRLFLAIEVPAEWREAARATTDAIAAASGVGLRRVDPAHMHLTLRFLGEVAEERLPLLHGALARRAPPVDFELSLGAAGTFGPPARTSVVWLGLGGDRQALHALVVRIEAAVNEAGLAPSEEAFTPHLTLARVGRASSPVGRRAIAEAVRAVAAPAPLSFRAHEVVLVRSHLGGGPPRYEVIGRFG
jgi:RNA 2',3'-cyclic 3'-phosphodiesterase